jgi:hypothetical protein
MAGNVSPIAREAIDPRFVGKMPGLIEALAPRVADVPEGGRQWVFYGSMPQGTAGKGSDVDALLLHDGGADHLPQRRSATWGTRPVTIYVLSHQAVAADGLERRFGGYFSLKLFSPFVTDRPALDFALTAITAGFLGPLGELRAADSDRSDHSGDQLLAQAHLAFLDLYPDFAGYLTRLLRDPGQRSRVWSQQRRTYVDALHSAGYITQQSQERWAYTGLHRIADPARERSRCAARFWAFGAICHGADPRFPDVYFEKTDGHGSAQEQVQARNFLCRIAGSEDGGIAG